MIVAAALALLPLVSAYSKTFVVPHTPGKDDSPAVVAAIANYSSDSLIIFKKGVTYNLWTVSTIVESSSLYLSNFSLLKFSPLISVL
jgi:hypothetical protein